MKHLLFVFVITGLLSCEKEPVDSLVYVESTVTAGTHTLSVFTIPNNTATYLVVFETGLGDFSKLWKESKVPETIMTNAAVLLYDRAGYNKSTRGPGPRDIKKLRTELEEVINKYADGRKVVLVGHSLGGYIIRDYAIRNPSKTAALLFVDPSHEIYNGTLTQSMEDRIYNNFKTIYGENYGATMEARELIEDAQYMRSLAPMPNIPVAVITSMKKTPPDEHSDSDRQLWYSAHESLKTGVTDFSHTSTVLSGHYIMKTEPTLVTNGLKTLLSKLP